jgi:low affinity Fe/Cu permease
VKQAFTRFAQGCATAAGSHWAFVGACVVIGGWLLTGPLFGFSDSWSLAINTVTTCVTFLMVFVIQNAQNRDTLAIMLKLNELVAADQQANNAVINAETLSDEDLQAMIAELQALAGGRNG